MNRRSLLFGLLLSSLGFAKEKTLKTFIITFPRDIKANEPIEVTAKDRIWAMAELGATVWTPEEYADAKRAIEHLKKLERPE